MTIPVRADADSPLSPELVQAVALAMHQAGSGECDCHLYTEAPPEMHSQIVEGLHDEAVYAIEAAEPHIRADERKHDRLAQRRRLIATCEAMDPPWNPDGVRSLLTQNGTIEAQLAERLKASWKAIGERQAVQAERERIAADVRAQFGPPRGHGAFLDGWNTAVSEFLALLADPAHKLRLPDDLVRVVRAGRQAETPRDFYDDGVHAERERLRQMAVVVGARYVTGVRGQPPCPEDCTYDGLMNLVTSGSHWHPFASLITDSDSALTSENTHQEAECPAASASAAPPSSTQPPPAASGAHPASASTTPAAAPPPSAATAATTRPSAPSSSPTGSQATPAHTADSQ